MAILHTYDFKEWAIMVAGVPLSGFDDEDGFEIEWETEWWTVTSGVDGEVTRNHVNNRIAKLHIKLKQTSQSNNHLTLMLLADTGAVPKTNATTIPVHIVSANGRGTYLGENCWIDKPPTVTGAKEAGMYEWVFTCPDLAPLISA